MCLAKSTVTNVTCWAPSTEIQILGCSAFSSSSLNETWFYLVISDLSIFNHIFAFPIPSRSHCVCVFVKSNILNIFTFRVCWSCINNLQQIVKFIKQWMLLHHLFPLYNFIHVAIGAAFVTLDSSILFFLFFFLLFSISNNHFHYYVYSVSNWLCVCTTAKFIYHVIFVFHFVVGWWLERMKMLAFNGT